MATISDVSRHSGVSRSTVSRLIAGNGYVSDTARKAVQAAIMELGYRPNILARGLRSNRSDIIGGVVVNIASPFHAQMVGGIQETCRSAGKGFLVSSGYAESDDEAKAILELIDRSCDGLILYLENPVRTDVQKVIGQSGIPVVTVGGEVCPVARARVSIDNFDGARAGMRHLLRNGHRKIAFLSGELAFHDTKERLRGIDAALAEFGLSRSDIRIDVGTFGEDFGFKATQRLLSDRRGLTAIFGGDDDISAGALLALKQARLRVPDEMSLLGFDDNFHARHLTPALTTIRQPIHEAGRVATKLLLEIIAGKSDTPNDIVVPTELILRDSVGPAPCPTPPPANS